MSQKLDYEEFKEYVKDNIKDNLPKEYAMAEVEIHPVIKNNGIILDGLTVHKEEQSIVPTIYINDSYKEYQRNENLDGVVHSLAVTYAEAMNQMPDMQGVPLEQSVFSEQAKERIVFNVCGYEANQVMLDTMPYERVEDMAITYQFVATQGEGEIGSIRITNELMMDMGLDKETLHELAVENTMRMYPPTLKGITEVMEELLFNKTPEAGAFDRTLPDDNMYVLSNQIAINGAAALFYPDMQEQLAEKLGGNYYVLPSSIHEVLLVPESEHLSQKALADMVKDVNETKVPANEVLTDNVYHYDQDEKKLTAFLHTESREEERKPSIKEVLHKAKEEQKKVTPLPRPEKVKAGMER